MVLTLVLVGSVAMTATPGPIPSPIPATVSAPRGVLPSVVHHAGQQAVDAYRAALQLPDVLQAVPCTCGCVESLGHENNLDCYIDEVPANGRVTYSTHGLYCTVCQFITRDAVAGAAAGMSEDDLYAMILERYGPRR
jgi:hypothetical protein